MKPSLNRTPATSENTDPRTLRKLVAARNRALGGTLTESRWSEPPHDAVSAVMLWSDGVLVRFAHEHRRKPEFLTHAEFLTRYAPTEGGRYRGYR